MLQYLRFTMSEVSLIYSVFKILICCFTLIFGIFNPHALKNLCALSWHFVFSLFSFSFNLTYDYFSLFLLALQCLMSTKRSHILKQPCTKGLRVIFLAYHVCLFSKFPFWNISSYQTNIISEENIMFILDFLIKLSSYVLLSSLPNRSCKVSQNLFCCTDFLAFFNPMVPPELILKN